ncbi:Hypothetical predicted protein [Marmota monax]|uniref:Ig-like domain-containing protein n=1 Tax=Marmota monax TaxID=9995 RepID=A0A5E4AS26_MARMO|nr:Hypothetical predicted protein [Marmota monax]
MDHHQGADESTPGPCVQEPILQDWKRKKGAHAGSGLGAHVSQHPSRAICESGTSVKIECRFVDFQASTAFWYRQFPKQSFVLMATSNVGSEGTYEQSFVKKKFPISHPNLNFASLESSRSQGSDYIFAKAASCITGKDHHQGADESTPGPCVQAPILQGWEEEEGSDLPREGGVRPTLKMLLLLLLLGPTGSGLGAHVSQHPSRAICESGTSVKIECRFVDFQASTVFWYRQFPKQGFVLMATSNVGSEGTHEQDFDKEKFPISHPNLNFASLMLNNAHSTDSSFYFCAGDTALGGSQRPRQEGLQQPALPHRPQGPCGRSLGEGKPQLL